MEEQSGGGLLAPVGARCAARARQGNEDLGAYAPTTFEISPLREVNPVYVHLSVCLCPGAYPLTVLGAELSTLTDRDRLGNSTIGDKNRIFK